MQSYQLTVGIVGDILSQQNILYSKITAFPLSGQRQVFNVKFSDGEDHILKFIDVTPYEAIDTQQRNMHFGLPLLDNDEFESLKIQEIERNSARIRRELKAAKDISIFPKFEIFDDLQIYRFEQIQLLYYFEEKVNGTPLKYSSLYSDIDGTTLEKTLFFIREMVSLIKLMNKGEKNYVHRDITPANILADAQDRYHLIDAGLVKSSDDSTITRMDAAIGTQRYRAHEQEKIIEEYEWDFRTDLFPIGLIAIEIFVPQTRNFSDDELRDLQEVFEAWKGRDNSPKSRKVFSKIIVKLSSVERIRRSNDLDELLNEIDSLIGGVR